MPTTPLYDTGQVVYLRESAAIGLIEPVRISGIMLGPDGGWLYSISASPANQAPGLYGDRRSLTNNATLWFSETELISQCDALLVAEANALKTYEQVHAQRLQICGGVPLPGETDLDG